MIRLLLLAAALLLATPSLAQNVSAPGGASFGTSATIGGTGRRAFCAYDAPGGQCLPFLALNPTSHILSLGTPYVQAVANTEQGAFLSAGPANVSFCQTIGCTSGDTSRATILAQMTTVGDGNRQEIGITSNVWNTAGYQYAADAINNGVEAGFFGVRSQAGGAKGWGIAVDHVLDAGWNSNFAAVAEFDLTNNAYDCQVSGTGPDGHVCAIFGAWVGGFTGAYPGTAAIDVSSPGNTGPVYTWHWGLAFTGDHEIKEKTIVDLTNSDTSYEIQGNHATAVIHDLSTSPVAFNAQGTYSFAAFSTVTSTAADALVMKKGQAVCFDGATRCLSWDAATNKFLLTTPEGGRIMSMDVNGNMAIKGALTQNGSP